MPENDSIELYRCKACGKLSVSIGYLHAHIEKHRGYGPFNILSIPGRVDKLNEYTEKIEVREYDVTQP